MGDPDKTTSPSHTVVTARPNVTRRTETREACLIVIYGDDLGRRVALVSDAVVIGRSSKCDVQIDQENVSRNHTRISKEGSHYHVRDLGSTNGTYVNDELVENKALRDGDQIKVGRTIFKFIFGNNIEAQYHEEIYRLMTVDGLTEVHNKRFFQEILEKETSRARRYKRTFSILMFDIDHFKQINDTHGHLAGDAVLRQLGALVRGRIRRDDIVCRIGGEEFSVLLPEVKLDGAAELGRKLRDLVEKTTFKFEGSSLRLTVSMGVAEWSNSMESYEDLVKIADSKLYEAKRAGRNHVCY